MYRGKSIGLIAEYNRRRVSIFDTDALEVLQQIEIDGNALDVAVNGDCSRAFVTTFESKTLYQIDLCANPARIAGSAVSETFLEDVAVTPDGRFALSVDGSVENQDIVSYSVRRNAFVSSLRTLAQAIAISPVSRELVLTAEIFNNSVHRFALRPDGTLEDSGQSFPAGARPINLAFSPSGEFAFVAAKGEDRITVLATRIPEQVVLIGGAPCSRNVQSVAVTRDARHVFALADVNVDIFSFDAVAGNLAFERSFAHGLVIDPFYGVDQLALDACDEKLFVSGMGRLRAFTTYGLPLGDVAGAEGPGGVAICRCSVT